MLPRSTGTSAYKPLPTDANLVDHDHDHDWLRNADDVDIERQAGLPTYPNECDRDCSSAWSDYLDL
jgi:hypothetical protein